MSDDQLAKLIVRGGLSEEAQMALEDVLKTREIKVDAISHAKAVAIHEARHSKGAKKIVKLYLYFQLIPVAAIALLMLALIVKWLLNVL